MPPSVENPTPTDESTSAVGSGRSMNENKGAYSKASDTVSETTSPGHHRLSLGRMTGAKHRRLADSSCGEADEIASDSVPPPPPPLPPLQRPPSIPSSRSASPRAGTTSVEGGTVPNIRNRSPLTLRRGSTRNSTNDTPPMPRSTGSRVTRVFSGFSSNSRRASSPSSTLTSRQKPPISPSGNHKSNNYNANPETTKKRLNIIRRNSPSSSTAAAAALLQNANVDEHDDHPPPNTLDTTNQDHNQQDQPRNQSPNSDHARQGSPSPSTPLSEPPALLRKSSASSLESSDDAATPRSRSPFMRLALRRNGSNSRRPSADSKDNFAFHPTCDRKDSFSSVGSDNGSLEKDGTVTSRRRRSRSPHGVIAAAAGKWRTSPSKTNTETGETDGAASAAAAAGETYVKMTDEEIDEVMNKKEEMSDPLIDLFDAHNTQRVRFNLAGVTSVDENAATSAGSNNHMAETIDDSDGGGAMDVPGISAYDSDGRDGSGTPSSKIKGFMKKVLFGTAKESPDLSMQRDPPTSGSLKKAFGFEQTSPPPPPPPTSSTSSSPLSSSDAAIERTSSSALRSPSFGNQDDGASPLASTSSTLSEFRENPKASARAAKLIGRAKRAQYESFKYEAAIGYYLAALSVLGKAGYPDVHPITEDTMKRLNDAHHAQVSLANSANIVKMGIRHENRGEFVRALKMYTIAYRIRRDALGKMHPSLPVILNMLGSVQVKRGELKEAMQLYALALHGRPDDNAEMQRLKKTWELHPNTKSVTLRDMGMIHERWGNEEKSLKLYCESLDCVMQNRRSDGKKDGNSSDKKGGGGRKQNSSQNQAKIGEIANSEVASTKKNAPLMGEVKFIKSHSGKTTPAAKKRTTNSAPVVGIVSPTKFTDTMEGDEECGEMEVYLNTSFNTLPVTLNSQNENDDDSSRFYHFDSIFPEDDETDGNNNGTTTGDNGYLRKKSARKGSKKAGLAGSRGGADVNVAMTIHQIAQIYRRRHQYAASLSAYQAALRGMKRALGHRHPNVAAILGNIGNLHKEMGNYDEAYGIYQEVLGIESLHLGLDHPEVSVTLHNIATIESSRGRYDDAITLYRQVLNTQRARFGPNHVCCAVTTSCMGDVCERMGDLRRAMTTYEETLRIRTELLGRQHIDVGRLLHKLGSLALRRGEYRVAETFVLRALSVYKVNDLKDDHPLMRDVARDEADIQARLAVGDERCEC